MDAFETFTHNGVNVAIYYDTDCTSPRDADNASTMIVQADRYADIDTPDFPNEREAFERGDYALLERYLRTACGVLAFGQWQSQRDCWGYAYVTREQADYLGVPHDRANEALKAETGEYERWAQGDCYGYVVDAGGPDEDSCWGFIGSEYAIKEAKAAVEYVVEAREERYREHRTLAARRGRPVPA